MGLKLSQIKMRHPSFQKIDFQRAAHCYITHCTVIGRETKIVLISRLKANKDKVSNNYFSHGDN